jgi:ABC-type bacteriocin/lantibiotic exporter with double-glycine peptidase domain
MFLKLSLAVSLYERAEPIFQAIPESSQSGIRPEKMQGQIEVRNLSFQYQPNHMILKDISLKVEPGSFTAIVGLSGSGKSTLMRLLLGFETSIEGHILYDQVDLSKYNILALRRKLGVVLQNDVLFPGTIYENISAASHLSLEDAWDAARIVGLEKEINAMPMGMHTLIVEGGATISSGQRQRIIIARALAYNPQICIFDEATSHLDNINQSLIHHNLSLLNITRVVIAQRLNTIIDANYIYVLDGGKLVQKGSFQELISQKGIFTRLAQKQGLS